MQSEEVVAIAISAIFVGGIISVYAIYQARHKEERMKRLEVMQKALEQPAMDPNTKTEMIRMLAEDQQQTQASRAETMAKLRTLGRTILVGAGWVLFAGCGGIILLHETGVFNWMFMEPVWTFFIIGFLAMTLPVAVRELASRSAPDTAKQ